MYAQELWDGKLRNTVKSFTKKVVKDTSLRNHLQNSVSVLSTDMSSHRAKCRVGDRAINELANKNINILIPPVPSWSRWSDENLVQRLGYYRITLYALMHVLVRGMITHCAAITISNICQDCGRAEYEPRNSELHIEYRMCKY